MTSIIEILRQKNNSMKVKQKILTSDNLYLYMYQKRLFALFENLNWFDSMYLWSIMYECESTILLV